MDLSRVKFVEKDEFIPKRSILNRVGRRVYRVIGMRLLIYRAKGIIHPDEFHILFNIGWYNSRYYVGPHTDNWFEAIFILVCFDDFPGEVGYVNCNNACHSMAPGLPPNQNDFLFRSYTE